MANDIRKIATPDGVQHDIKTEEMIGATSSKAGASGSVPAPAAGDNGKFLRGDGTWHAVGYKFSVDLSTGNLMYESD